jgi:hypothetical protein
LGWYDYGARMYNPNVGRWNGVDPLAEKYQPISPYVYVANNPLKFIDPNGEEIWVTLDNGETVQYRDGKYWSDYENGEKYKGRKGKFGRNTLKALNHIAVNGGEVGEDLIKRLASAPATTKDGTGFKVTINYQEGGGTYQGDRVAGGSGDIAGPLGFDPSIGLVNENGEILSPSGALAHELGHGALQLDDYEGTLALSKIKWFDTEDMQYSSQEEREVIERFEKPISSSMGMPFNRNQHGLINDAIVKVKGGPTSNTSKNSDSATQKASKLREAIKDPASYRKQRYYDSGADPNDAPWKKN